MIKIQYEETHVGEPLSFAQEIGFGLETEPGMVYPGMTVPITTIPIQFDMWYANEPGAGPLPSGIPYPGTHIQPYPVPSAVRYSDEPDFENEEMFGIGGEPAKYFTVTGEPYVTTEPGEEELTPRKPETPVEQLTRLGVGYLGSEPRATFARPDMAGEHGEYTIKAGDTLGELATRFNTTIPILMQINDITDRNEITTGTTLEIPTKKRVLSDAESPEIYVDEPNDGRPASSYTVSTKTNIIESIRAELATIQLLK